MPTPSACRAPPAGPAPPSKRRSFPNRRSSGRSAFRLTGLIPKKRDSPLKVRRFTGISLSSGACPCCPPGCCTRSLRRGARSTQRGSTIRGMLFRLRPRLRSRPPPPPPPLPRGVPSRRVPLRAVSPRRSCGDGAPRSRGGCRRREAPRISLRVGSSKRPRRGVGEPPPRGNVPPPPPRHATATAAAGASRSPVRKGRAAKRRIMDRSRGRMYLSLLQLPRDTDRLNTCGGSTSERAVRTTPRGHSSRSEMATGLSTSPCETPRPSPPLPSPPCP